MVKPLHLDRFGQSNANNYYVWENQLIYIIAKHYKHSSSAIGQTRKENFIKLKHDDVDSIRKEQITGTTKLSEISKKVQERRLTWYDHVMRREVGLYLEGDGIAVQVNRRGRPNRW